MKTSFPLAAALSWLSLSLTVSPVHAKEVKAEPEEPFLLSFVVGDYALAGQYPDSTTPYSGVARIEKKGGRLLLTRLIGPDRTQAEGRIEVPHPPGEGEVVRFRWTEKGPQVMSCLVKGDLDNYARLTCVWGGESGPRLQPGIEAYFPTAVWPDDAPSKGIRPDSPKKGD